jgi:hypothetical protein
MTDTHDPTGGLPMPMRGAIPTPRHILAAATPFAPAVAGRAAMAPAQFIKVPAKISMWGNDVHGDCVTAEEAFAKACHNPEIFVKDAEVIRWATAHGVLEGAYLHEVLQWMTNDGFRQDNHMYDDGASLSVNWMDRHTLTNAIAIGPVKIGIGADQVLAAYNAGHRKNGWFGLGFHKEPKEDHCTSLCGYGPLKWLAQQLHGTVPHGVDGNKFGYAMFTWNSIGILDEPSMRVITYEAWLRRPTTVIKPAAKAGAAPEAKTVEPA